MYLPLKMPVLMAARMAAQRNCFKMLQIKVSRQTLWTNSCKSLTGCRNLHVSKLLIRPVSRTCTPIAKSVIEYPHMADDPHRKLKYSAWYISSRPWNASKSIHTSILSQCSKTESVDGVEEDVSSTQEDDFTEVLYKEPNMRRLFLLNKMKTYQGIFVAGYIPFLSYFYIHGDIGAITLFGQSCLTLSLLGGMYYMSASFLSHIAGSININASGEQLKIARMTLWKGNKQEDIIDVVDVIPLAALTHRRERFRKIKLYSGEDYYFVDKKRGYFPNKEKFVEIFGK